MQKLQSGSMVGELGEARTSVWLEQSKEERGAGKIIELGVWMAVEASQVTLSMKWELESPHPNLPQQKPGAQAEMVARGRPKKLQAEPVGGAGGRQAAAHPILTPPGPAGGLTCGPGPLVGPGLGPEAGGCCH